MANIHVRGMDVGDRATTVRERLGRLDGVSDVRVDPRTGMLAVTSEAPLDLARLRAVVEEVGCELVDP